MSQGGTALAVLREHAPRPVDVATVAEAVYGSRDADARNKASMLLATRLARGTGPRSAWRFVRRAEFGRYVYDESYKPPPPWEEVARDHTGALVLRSPDGRLYAAHPITEEHPS